MKLSIKQVLIIGVIGLQVLSVCLILASSYLTSQRVLRKHAQDMLANVATFTVHEVQNYLAPARDVAQLTQELVNHHIIRRETIAILERYFYEQLRLHANLAGIYLGLPSGAFIYVNRSDDKVAGGFRTKIIQVTDGVKTTELIWQDANLHELMREFAPQDTYDPTSRPWYVRAQESQRTIWTEPYVFFTSQQPGITVSTPIRNTTGEQLGIVGVDIQIDALSTFLSQLKIGESGRAFIVNRSGVVVAFPDLDQLKWPTGSEEGKFRLARVDELDDELTQKTFAATPRLATPFDVRAPMFRSFQHERKEYHAMLVPFANSQWPWTIGLYLPEDDYLGPIKRNRRLNIYLMLGIAGVGSFLGGLIVRSVTTPMRALQLEVQAVNQNDLETTFDKHSMIREIQETADSFTQMKVGLQTVQQKNNDLTQDLREQADALRRSEVRYRSLVEGSLQGIVMIQGSRIQFANQPAAFFFGYDEPEALVGRELLSLLDPSTPLSDDGQLISREVQARHPDGTRRWLSCELSEIVWEGQAACLVTCIDITVQRQLEQEVLMASERERHHLGQDLHDGLGQQLTGLSLLSSRVERQLVQQDHPEAATMIQLSRFLKEAVNQTHDLAHASYPVILESEGLGAALQSLREQAESLYGLTVGLTRPREALRLPAHAGIHLYRIAQEALTNAVKHGQAEHVSFELVETVSELRFQIDDDGCGFPDTDDFTPGMGIRNMKYRARLIGASFEVGRNPEGGVRIVSILPLLGLPTSTAV